MVDFAPDGTIFVDVDGMFNLNWHPDTPDMVEIECTTADDQEDWDRAYIPVSLLNKFAGEVVKETLAVYAEIAEEWE